MHIGQYIPGDSPIHRLDPRVKIGSTLALSILILRGETLSATVISVLLLLLIALSGLGGRSILRAFRPVWVFFALLFVVHLVFTDGTPIPPFPRWPVTMTYEGLAKGTLTVWQFALLVLAASNLTMTTSAMELISGMTSLLGPLRRIGVPSHDLAMMVSIALRFVPTFLEEIDRMRVARMARGAGFRSGSVARRTRAVLSLLPPLIVQTIKRADGLVTAMEARCYQRGPRTYLRELSLGRADYTAMGVMVLMTGLLVIVG